MPANNTCQSSAPTLTRAWLQARNTSNTRESSLPSGIDENKKWMNPLSWEVTLSYGFWEGTEIVPIISISIVTISAPFPCPNSQCVTHHYLAMNWNTLLSVSLSLIFSFLPHNSFSFSQIQFIHRYSILVPMLTKERKSKSQQQHKHSVFLYR